MTTHPQKVSVEDGKCDLCCVALARYAPKIVIGIMARCAPRQKRVFINFPRKDENSQLALFRPLCLGSRLFPHWRLELLLSQADCHKRVVCTWKGVELVYFQRSKWWPTWLLTTWLKDQNRVNIYFTIFSLHVEALGSFDWKNVTLGGWLTSRKELDEDGT